MTDSDHRTTPARSLELPGMEQDVGEALLGAQRKAEQLFQLVVDEGLIQPGVLESELSKQI